MAGIQVATLRTLLKETLNEHGRIEAEALKVTLDEFFADLVKANDELREDNVKAVRQAVRQAIRDERGTGGAAVSAGPNAYMANQQFMERVLNSIVMSGMSSTEASTCCYFSKPWVEHELKMMLEQHRNKPAGIRTCTEGQLQDYLDFHQSKKSDDLPDGEPSRGGFQYLRFRYKTVIGNKSTIIVRTVVEGLGLGPMFGQRPRRKAGKRGPAATEEEVAAFERLKEEFTGRVNAFLNLHHPDPSNPVAKASALWYRRGDSNAVLATSTAREALHAAFDTGTDEVVATLMQLSMMDVKVVLRLLNPDLSQDSVGSKHERAWMELTADLMEEVLQKGQRVDGDQPVFDVGDSCQITVTDMCCAAIITHLQAEITELGSYSRTLEFLELDERFRDEWEPLPPHLVGGRHGMSMDTDEEHDVDNINGGGEELDGDGVGGYLLGKTHRRSEGSGEESEEGGEGGGDPLGGASTSKQPAKKTKGGNGAAASKRKINGRARNTRRKR